MIIRTQFEIDSCSECWFFEVDDYCHKCKLLGDYLCELDEDFDVHDEICSKCPFKDEICDEDKDTIDLDAYPSYMRRKKNTMNVNQATKLIDKLVEEISEELLKENSEELLKENAPRNTGVLQKTPRKVMIHQLIQMQLDALIDRIFDTDDDYMNNQRWKKRV